MNLSIMYGMLNYLMNKNKVSAQELAEVFEIHQRSVYRYVAHLADQGIPIDTQIGRNGGIMIDKKFKLDRILLTSDELFFLKSLLIQNPCENSTNIINKLNLF